MELLTDRLMLRPPEESDADDALGLLQDPDRSAPVTAWKGPSGRRFAPPTVLAMTIMSTVDCPSTPSRRPRSPGRTGKDTDISVRD